MPKSQQAQLVETDVRAYLLDVRQRLLDLTGVDAGYAQAEAQGVHAALLADLYRYNGAAVTRAILARIDYRDTRNPITWIRKRRTVRGLTRLGSLWATHPAFFNITTQQNTAWQDEHANLSDRLATLLLGAQYRLTRATTEDFRQARMVANSILDMFYHPEALNSEEHMTELRYAAVYLSEAILSAAREDYAACLNQIRQFPPPKR